jgi:hypothetical protein
MGRLQAGALRNSIKGQINKDDWGNQIFGAGIGLGMNRTAMVPEQRGSSMCKYWYCAKL